LTRTFVVSLLLCAVASGCQVAPGTTPDASCAPAPDFFVSTVSPDYLFALGCSQRNCHAFQNGHGYLRLRDPETPPAPGTPVDEWPTGWRENYFSAIQLVRCDAPLESRLLIVPQGQSNLHPPGPVVSQTERPIAAAMFQTWVSAP
jgi:hypothetical protein